MTQLPGAASDGPRSLWHRTAPGIATDGHLPDRTDVLVVGAGLTGLSAALMLTRAGRRVVVIEGRRVGSVTTGNTTGKVSVLQGTVLSGIRERHGPGLLRGYVAANLAGQEWLIDELRTDGLAAATLVRAPAVTLATSPSGEDTVRKEASAAREAGLEPELVAGPADILGLPFSVSLALRLDAQWQLHPMHMLAHLVLQIQREGGHVVEECRATALDPHDRDVTVHTTRGDIRAAHVIVATGTPILDRGLFFAKLEPSRSVVGAYRLDDDARLVDSMILSVDAPRRSLRTARDELSRPVLVVGGGGFFPGREPSVRAVLDGVDDWTTRWFGPAERVAWWAAQDYRTFTHLPFAAVVPRGGGRVLAATGYNKWGMTNAVAAAMAITGTITGNPPSWAAVYARNPTARAAAEAVGANSEVARRLATGWGPHRPASAPTSARVFRDGTALVAESTVQGVTCRLSAVCTHLGGIVEWNDAERSWDCPLHGSRFAWSGEVLEGPAVTDLPRATSPR